MAKVALVLMLAKFGMLQQQQALAVHCVQLSAQPHHVSASGSVISLRQDSDQLGLSTHVKLHGSCIFEGLYGRAAGVLAFADRVWCC